MDIDENDILMTNVFINNPDTTVVDESNEEFKKYYKKEKLKKEIDNLKTKKNTETQEFTEKLNERKTREVKTFVSIDSRDRTKILYTKPNYFKIFLGRTLYNVKNVRLASIEFPNTNAVINSSNNRIYWRNQEDIDDDIIDNITKKYPIYSVELRIGSYIATTLGNEMTSKLVALKRKNKTGDFHYFSVNLDIDTDIVTMTSLILTQLPNNPLSVTAGLGLITVNAPNHGYSTGDKIYMIGTKSVAGITSTSLGGEQTITVLNANTFQYEINIKAGETSLGGGNTLKTGRLAPFQLLFGEKSNTLAPNIGYPFENSSQSVNTFIKSIVDYYQIRITMAEHHNMLNTFDYIGQVCLISSSGTTPNIDGNRVITKIIDEFTILVSVNQKLDFGVSNSGELIFDGRNIGITSITNNDINTVLIETFTEHNYEASDINSKITLYNTTSVPTFDEENVIYSIPSDKLIVIPGELLDGGEVNVVNPGDGGSLPYHLPLYTYTMIITNVIPGNITTITCNNHGLVVGDRVKIFNLVTSPSITNVNAGIHNVYTILDNNTFTINFETIAYDEEIVNKEEAYIGLQKIKVKFPYHGFNKITFITPVVDLIDPLYNVEITTQLSHNLVDGDSVRVMNTDTTPIIDEGGYIVKVIDSDTFRIIFPGGIGVSVGTYGIMGMSNDFYIYGATSIGEIPENGINNILYTVKDIIDENTFTFDCASFAEKSEKGGGNNMYISSLKHGFNGIQTNTKNSLLNRSINLEGENYAFLCCPTLSTMMNTGDVKNIFARITLDQSPGSMVFNFLSNPKEFDTAPLNKLEELEFSIVNYDGTLYEFNDLDYSMTFEIIELVDTTENFNYSSRRGVS